MDCGVTRRDRVRNKEIRKKMWASKKMSKRRAAAVLWWIGHIKRMEREKLVKKIYRVEVEGNRERGRLRRRWMDGVKGCLSDRGLNHSRS